ncbi:MAG: chitobiase/beta-hexosaminidase C-terminal domain-containing protein [archaeon]|jgi:FlaG/FlaF family flagellin (archaellin)
MIKTNKGASEVIVVTLIIVVTVILAGIFFAWLKESSNTQLDQTSMQLKEASDLSCSNATFKIESFDLDEVNRKISFVLSNNSDLKIFNLILSVQGKDAEGVDLKISGRFDTIVESGQMVSLSTDSNFTYISGDISALGTLDFGNLTNITLTNGTCPKKILLIDSYDLTLIQSDLVADPNADTFFESQNITLSSEEGATIYYTTDGSDPTIESEVYVSPINIPLDTVITINAISVKPNYETKDFTGKYTVTHILATPTADPEPYEFTRPIEVRLFAEDGATIYYTLDSSIPGGKSMLYESPILINSTTVINAIAVRDGYGDSDLFTGTYTSLESYTLEYNTSSGVLTLELIPDLSIPLSNNIAFRYFGAFKDPISTSASAATTSGFLEANPSPYEFKDCRLIRFDCEQLALDIGMNDVDRFEIIEIPDKGSINVLITILPDDITIVSDKK